MRRGRVRHEHARCSSAMQDERPAECQDRGIRLGNKTDDAAVWRLNPAAVVHLITRWSTSSTPVERTPCRQIFLPSCRVAAR